MVSAGQYQVRGMTGSGALQLAFTDWSSILEHGCEEVSAKSGGDLGDSA